MEMRYRRLADTVIFHELDLHRKDHQMTIITIVNISRHSVKIIDLRNYNFRKYMRQPELNVRTQPASWLAYSFRQ